jgi:hypothetical protein
MEDAAMTDREQIAQNALDRCYGQHADAIDRERAWGLKASPEDAVLAILAALYPNEGWTNTAAGIERLRADYNDLADTYNDAAQNVGDAADLVAEILPIIDTRVSPPVGARVQLRHAVDRYPHFLAPEGATGTVTEATADVYAVRMDTHLDGAEDWDNQIHWYPTSGDTPLNDITAL